jgi:sulfide:quinone oxidoreductase
MTLPLTNATVVIVGGGAGGLATAASLLRRRPDLNVTVIEPRDTHYYQPGWTLVGGGIFDQAKTARAMASTLPPGAKWHQAAVTGFEPALNRLSLKGGTHIGYDAVVVAPGIELNWDGIEGLRDTLGQNGVTSNYAFDLAPYTDRLVRDLRGGRALFTQPPMPTSALALPRRPCICPATAGAELAASGTSMWSSILPAPTCSGSSTSCRPSCATSSAMGSI